MTTTLNRDENVCQEQYLIENIVYGKTLAFKDDYREDREDRKKRKDLPTEFIVWVDKYGGADAEEVVAAETGYVVYRCVTKLLGVAYPPILTTFRALANQPGKSLHDLACDVDQAFSRLQLVELWELRDEFTEHEDQVIETLSEMM